MRFQPKSEKEINQTRVLPPGKYDFEVIKAEEKTSAIKPDGTGGNEMIHLVLKVWDKDGGTSIVHDYLLESVAYKLRHFAYATGMGIKYEAGSLCAEDCQDAGGKVALRIEEDRAKKYPPKNAVQDYVTPEDYQEQKEAVGTAVMKQGGGLPLSDDDIPF